MNRSLCYLKCIWSDRQSLSGHVQINIRGHFCATEGAIELTASLYREQYPLDTGYILLTFPDS
jgi:hypothetical protein